MRSKRSCTYNGNVKKSLRQLLRKVAVEEEAEEKKNVFSVILKADKVVMEAF